MLEASRRRYWQIPAYLMLVLLAAGVGARAQVAGEIHLRAGAGVASAMNYSAQWDAMDSLIDLTGLWSSIDRQMDAEPVMETSPLDGSVNLFWARWRGTFHEIVTATRAPGGTWSTVTPIEMPLIGTQDRRSAKIVTDPSGFLHVVWLENTSAGGSLYHSIRFGSSWMAPLKLSGLGDVQRAEISVVGTETRVIYWTRFEIITLKITIFTSSGGSDDIDPVHVNSTELWHTTIAPK